MDFNNISRSIVTCPTQMCSDARILTCALFYYNIVTWTEWMSVAFAIQLVSVQNVNYTNCTTETKRKQFHARINMTRCEIFSSFFWTLFRVNSIQIVKLRCTNANLFCWVDWSTFAVILVLWIWSINNKCKNSIAMISNSSFGNGADMDCRCSFLK